MKISRKMISYGIHGKIIYSKCTLIACNFAPCSGNNIWNNLGQLFEVIVEGGTSTGAMRIGDGNEDFSEVSAFPSTYTFVVPAEAEGCTSLRLSRDVCQCRLYLTEIHISRMNEDISGIAGTTLYTCSPVFDLQGRKATNAMRGIIISNGRKYVNKNNKIGN